MSARLNIIVLVLLVVSALALIRLRNESRILYYTLEQTQEQSRQLDLAWSELLLDRSIYGKPARVETLATDKLNMVPIKPSRIQYLVPSAR